MLRLEFRSKIWFVLSLNGELHWYLYINYLANKGNRNTKLYYFPNLQIYWCTILFPTLPLQLGRGIFMPNLRSDVPKASKLTAFVTIFASWSFNLTNGRLVIFASKFSFMKCLSISTCFVLSCWTRFPEMLMAALLSQWSFHTVFCAKPSWQARSWVFGSIGFMLSL